MVSVKENQLTTKPQLFQGELGGSAKSDHPEEHSESFKSPSFHELQWGHLDRTKILKFASRAVTAGRRLKNAKESSKFHFPGGGQTTP